MSKTKKERQKMLSFAFLSDLESSKKITSQAIEEPAAGKRIKKFLASDGCIQSVGKWELAQNPVIYAAKPKGVKKGLVALNTTVILKNAKQTEYIIGVAGTNFISVYDWFIEDLEVTTQIPWNKNIINYDTPQYKKDGNTSNGYISQSTAIALSNTWNKKNADQKTVIELLAASLPKLSNTTINISITGHSLGGAISPALAQALLEHQDLWNPHKLEVTISTYIFAGPTPGDETWVKYVKNSLDSVSSTYNRRDLVPHAWELDMIPKMRNLFAPNLTATNIDPHGKIADTLIDYIESKSNSVAHPYRRWGNPNTIFDSEKRFKGVLPGAGPYSANMSEAKALTTIIEYAWTKSLIHKKPKNLDVLEALCKVCGIKATLSRSKKIKSVKPYLIYFSQFIGILAEEHNTQYQKWLKNPFYYCSMKYYLKMGTPSSFELLGIGVMYKLFLTLGDFVGNES